MKLKLMDRVMLLASAAVALLSGLAVIVFSLQTSVAFFAAEDGGYFTLRRIIFLLMGILLFLVGCYLAGLPFRMRYSRRGFIIQQTDNGELRIAIKAIDSLVKKCVDMHEEMRLISMDITNARGGVTIDLGISLANNISIPLAVASLQRQIKQYLLASSGIDVCDVRVLVETADSGVGESPYLVNNEIASTTPASEEAPKGKGKIPLHRRIFSKPEQPAAMPQTPPAPQEALREEDAPKMEDAPAPEETDEAPLTEEQPAAPNDGEEGKDHEPTA